MILLSVLFPSSFPLTCLQKTLSVATQLISCVLHLWSKRKLFLRTTVMFNFHIASSIILSIQSSFLYLSMSHWYVLLSNFWICRSMPCFWPCYFNWQKTSIKFLGSLMTCDTKEGKNKETESSGCFASIVIRAWGSPNRQVSRKRSVEEVDLCYNFS